MTETTPKTTLTTEVLGVAEAKAKDGADLSGYVLNARHITDAVTRVFHLLGVDVNDIRCVKLACDADGKPRIITEVRYKAVKATGGAQHTHNWTDFMDGESENTSKESLDRKLYDALRNCAFHGKNKNLIWRKVVRGDVKYAQIEFDPYIFVAFAYNINFADKFFKISAPATRWMSDEQLDELSGKERKKVMRTIQEYKNESLKPCTFYVTFSAKSNWKLGNGTVITGFHPSQVEYCYAQDDDDNGGKKKKKHKNDD